MRVLTIISYDDRYGRYGVLQIPFYEIYHFRKFMNYALREEY